jgi:hypothetical protein
MWIQDPLFFTLIPVIEIRIRVAGWKRTVSRIWDEHPSSFSKSVETLFVIKILKYFDGYP